MRPTILLTSLLAIIPFISATSSPTEPARRDGADFLPSYQVKNGPTYDYKGCHRLSTLNSELPAQPQDLTIEKCISGCYTYSPSSDLAGVGYLTCFCGNANGATFPAISEASCKADTCPGNSMEFCGSVNGLVLYQRV